MKDKIRSHQTIEHNEQHQIPKIDETGKEAKTKTKKIKAVKFLHPTFRDMAK